MLKLKTFLKEKLHERLKKKYPDVPWRNIIGMRNILVHDYFDIDINTVWNVVENELTPLKHKIQKILSG